MPEQEGLLVGSFAAGREDVTCKHPKESRELLAGYDVLCGECGEMIGRVALFPCAVLAAEEAEAVLGWSPDEATTYIGRSAIVCLKRAIVQVRTL